MEGVQVSLKTHQEMLSPRAVNERKNREGRIFFPCRENPGMCRGKGSGKATATEVLSKQQSRKMLCTAFWAGDKHRVAQFVRKDAANLLSESPGRRFICLNGCKKPFGTRCERQSSGLTQPKYTDLERSFHDKNPSSGLFVLSGLNKRQDDGAVLSNQRRECFRGKI